MTLAEDALKLLGSVEGRRVVELGWTDGPAIVGLARSGAIAIAVSPSTDQLGDVRRLAEAEEVRVELHESDLADLAFLRADSVDAVYSDGALARAGDIHRVIRQANRVLRPGAPFVFTLPHPAEGRSISDVFMSLIRAGFRVDALFEPPGHLLIRARKEGL